MDLTLLPTRRRAAEFDRALDLVALDGAPPPQLNGLTDDVALAVRLCDAGAALAPEPSTEFRTALRTRLLAVAAVQGIGETAAAPVQTPVRAPARVPVTAAAAVSWRQRAAAVGAGVMATVVAVSGVAVASSQSLPGDPFYVVKRTTESVQLRLADGAQEEGERHLQFAATRLREVRALVLGRDGEGRDGSLSAADDLRVREALDDMDVETRAALKLLTDAFRETEEPGPLEALTEFADRQRRALVAVLPALAAPSRSRAEQSLALVADVRSQADELLLLADCTGACDPTSTAPVLPPAQTLPDAAAPPCACPTPLPAPSVAAAPSATPSSSSGASRPTASPSPSPSASSEPSASPTPSPTPTPSRSPSSSPPLPLPVPTVPSLPPLPPLDDALDPVQVPRLSGDDGALGGLLGVAPLLVIGPGAASVTHRVLHWWRRRP